jgi:hypothetical protein
MTGKFCRHLASSTPNEGFFYMPQICDMGPTEGMLRIFSSLKKSDGFGRVRTRRFRVPDANMLTPRPPKSACIPFSFIQKSIFPPRFNICFETNHPKFILSKVLCE